MKILWVKTDFLHPTNRGGQIRTLEMLRRLHARNEVHYVAYHDPADSEGLARASEYATRVVPVTRPIPARGTLKFWKQLTVNAVSRLPLAVGRYESDAMKQTVAALAKAENYDAVVCDFLSSAPNMPDLSKTVIFQHNVESVIWQRHAEHAADPLRRAYFRNQAARMLRCEREYCRAAAGVIAVSEQDAEVFRKLFGIEHVTAVPTGVDTEYFERPGASSAMGDIVFCGAMDWLPNVDGIGWFAAHVLPRIRQRRPACQVTLAGRSPAPEVRALARDPLIQVTGTVPDIRPFLWGSQIAIVPLRIGGGTRLKIYEAMAAGVPVVSTSVGAEGLDVTHGVNILLADTAEAFAVACLLLLEQPDVHQRIAVAARELVTSRFSWEKVTQCFEHILQSTCVA
ncbi:MAG TPA: hypothetical protein DEQ47_08625 [Solibacterales bacterium]|nr:hypothetical protein [Bryobacterales bacterium]